MQRRVHEAAIAASVASVKLESNGFGTCLLTVTAARALPPLTAPPPVDTAHAVPSKLYEVCVPCRLG